MSKNRFTWTIVEIFIVTFIIIHFLTLVFEIKKLPTGFRGIDYLWISSIILLIFKKYVEIEAMKIKNKELKREAYVDAYTGLPNRNSCEVLLSKYKNLDGRKHYGVVVFDLNNLKVINDSFGHNVGDKLIRDFSLILKSNANSNIFVGRYGGDEFIAFFLNEGKEYIEDFIRGMRKDIDKFNSANRDYSISYACGYDLCYGGEGVSLKDVLNRADKYMYENKAIIKGKSVKMVSSL